ncbi:MAG: protein kinase domain-containing protein [Acidobacteriota bacterium]
MATPHLDADTLAAYVDGRLAIDERGAADRHIDACTTCRRELSSLAALQSHPVGVAIEAPEGLLGRYHVLRELGRGSMGIVLRAYDPELARPVAIKLLRDVDDNTRELVRREARALARLRHPNVVTVYDVIVEDERMYIAMELVEGDTLRGHCKGRPAADVLAACVRAGRGLAAAHEAGIVHRDFKPENVLCTPDGEARVSDFGLAGIAEDVPHERAILGTPAYMAPEILRGQGATAASDQYSFCVTVHEMLTGERPVDRSSAAPRVAARRGGAAAGEGIARDALPAWVARVLERGLASEPAARYPAMTALLAELEHDPRVRRRRRGLLAGGALAALATGALGVRLATPAAKTCAIDARALDGAWDAARKREVTAAITAAAGDDIASKVVAALDDYASGWIAARRDACEAAHARGEQPAELLGHRVACLDRGRRELGELTRVLASADAKVSLAAREAIGRLREPAACSAGDSDRVPDDLAGRVLVEEGRAVLDRATALQLVGKLDDAEALTTGLIAQLDAARQPQLLGEALLIRGRIESEHARHDRAEATLFDALAAAERAHDDGLVATIWVELVMTTGAEQHRFDVAMAEARAADAALARIDPGADLQLRYTYTVAGLLLAHGDLAAGRKRFEAGLQLAGDDPRRAAQAGLIEVSLCDADRQLGKLAAAKDECGKGLAMLERSLGRDHLRVAVALNTAGALAFGMHDLAAAEQSYQRAIDIFERRGLRDHVVYALALSNLGAVYSSRDDVTRAQQLFERADEMFAKYHPKHPQRLFALQGLASLAERRGDADHAVRYYEQVRDATYATYAADSPQLSIVDFNLALSYRLAKQPAKAQQLLDRMAARALAPGNEQWVLAARALDLSATLADDRKDFAAALALRDRALAAVAHADDAETRAMIERALGETQRMDHHPELAVAPLEHALAYYTAHADDPYEVGLARYAYAMALWESGRDRARAIVLAKQAAADLAKAQSGDELARYRDELAAFLREHSSE